MIDAGAMGGLGAMTLIKTITISSDTGTVSFVDGASSVVLDNTYPIYQFDFINIHPSEDDRQLQFNMSVDTGSNYNVAKTTTYFLAQHSENNDTAQVAYNGTHDLAQGTGFQTLALAQGNANDEGVSGSLTLFNPSSTTFVKHFTSVTNNVAYVDRSFNNTSAGYGNTTSAVDAIQFKFSGGSIGSGIFKLYGIKDS
jgi:3-oxoacyl-[acyl-carrier-protein] synthase III